LQGIFYERRRFMTHHYLLKCQLCGTELEDDGFLLHCPVAHEPALLLSQYTHQRFEPDVQAQDITRYRNWLPWQSSRCAIGKTLTYKSKRLNDIIGLPNLWIAFNGYWPEREAKLETATFKELEAYAVLSRLPEQSERVLVLASAGNTAAAFGHLCSQNRIRCLIIIPQQGLQRMGFSQPLGSGVKVVTVSGPSAYYDAIRLAERISQRTGFFYEGGVKNVGRRDGIGTTLLNAAETIGRLPDYYFQAIGSGTGGIAVHEAAKRLLVDGKFGRKLPRLMLSQNSPFAPMYYAWKSGRRELLRLDSEVGKRQIQQTVARVLSNQKPPYSVRGGVFEVLQESQGDMLVATNRETLQAMKLFEDSEGVDIDPAAGVALASLLKAVRSGWIEREVLVLLHITGGGWQKRRVEKKWLSIEPALEIEVSAMLAEETIKKVAGLFE
jgi:cysteate synthase